MAGRGASGKIKELNVPEKACFDSAQVLRQKKKKKEMLPYSKVDEPSQVLQLLSVRELCPTGKEFWEGTV